MILRNLPFLKVLAIAQVVLLVGRHVRHLDAKERRRVAALARKGRATTPQERKELRGLIEKLDLRALAGGAASKLSPVPLPKRLTGARS